MSVDYASLAVEAFTQVETYLDEPIEPNWEYVTEVEACAMYRRIGDVDQSGIYTVRTVAEFNFSPKRIFEFIWNLDNRKLFDEYVQTLTTIEKIPEDKLVAPVKEMDLLYASFGMPFPIYSRDFVHIRAYKYNEETGVYLTSAKSTTHPSYPNNPKFVRGEIAVDGFQIIPNAEDPNKSIVKYVARVDPKGSIPTFAVNLANRKVPSTMAAIKRAIGQQAA